MRILTFTLAAAFLFTSCGAKGKKNIGESVISDSSDQITQSHEIETAKSFNADSAFVYLATQVNLGPRVPNTPAHKITGDYLVSELKRHGADVIEQRADLKAFDGTILKARNIFGQLNKDASDRILLVAHYDCRPWADQDPDPEKRKNPVDGANDGASGVAVLLEIARQLSLSGSQAGVDILFVDAEDWGTDNDEDSWALGARYFVNNPILPGYSPSEVIVADMVGGKDANFPMEYFSQQNYPDLTARIWQSAAQLGHADRFPAKIGGAVTDDHIEFIKAGIPAADIIEYHPGSGFNPHWHTSTDNLENIDPETLKVVGETILHHIYKRN